MVQSSAPTIRRGERYERVCQTSNHFRGQYPHRHRGCRACGRVNHRHRSLLPVPWKRQEESSEHARRDLRLAAPASRRAAGGLGPAKRPATRLGAARRSTAATRLGRCERHAATAARLGTTRRSTAATRWLGYAVFTSADTTTTAARRVGRAIHTATTALRVGRAATAAGVGATRRSTAATAATAATTGRMGSDTTTRVGASRRSAAGWAARLGTTRRSTTTTICSRVGTTRRSTTAARRVGPGRPRRSILGSAATGSAGCHASCPGPVGAAAGAATSRSRVGRAVQPAASANRLWR